MLRHNWEGGGVVMGGCPLSISVPNYSLDCQETVHLACEWANCVNVCSSLFQTNAHHLSDLTS